MPISRNCTCFEKHHFMENMCLSYDLLKVFRKLCSIMKKQKENLTIEREKIKKSD